MFHDKALFLSGTIWYGLLKQITTVYVMKSFLVYEMRA